MRKLLCVCAILLCFLTINIWAADVLIKDVSVRVLDNFGTDATDVLSFCSVQAGQTLSQEALSKDVRTLLDTGRYGYAGVELAQVDDGVNVVYVIKRRYRFQEPLAIRGAEFFKESKIRKYAELKSGDYIDEPVLATKVARVRDEYIKRFYPDVKVGVEINPIEDGAGAAHVVFVIDEGERAKIKEFKFAGNSVFTDKELRASFGKRPWYDPRGWFRDAPVREQDLEDARQLAEDVYKNAGYLDARVAAPETERLTQDYVTKVFAVYEGDLYTVESTAIRGVKLFPEREVLAAGDGLPVDAIAGQQAIADAAKAIRDYYGSRGYVDTVVRPQRENVPGKPGRMALTYDVREGELVHIRNIVIRGNNKTKDKVIRREILVNPAEIMNEPRIERSENRLKNLQYFKSVRHYTEETPEQGVRDLIYEVEEQRTGNFMIGVGISSVDNVVGFLEVTQSNFDILNWPNFTGGGQKARLGLELGPRRQTAEVSWTEPWFLDRALALHVDAYRRLRWHDQYDDVRTGGSVGLSYPIKVGRFGVRYTLENVDMQDVSKNDWSEDKHGNDVAGDGDSFFLDHKDRFSGNLNSIARVYWSHDTRNHPFIPTKGFLTTWFAEIAEGGVGDNEFARLGASYRHWFALPWYKHVVSLKGRVETIDDYNGDGVPVYERYFLGGPRTIRGVKYRDVGPKAYNSDERHAPMGGNSLALGTIEYTIPIFKAVRFATFMDVGSLSDDSFDISSDFSMTAGIGFRIDIPGFPMRFDFARPFVDDDSDTKKDFFSFMIGFE